MLEFQIASSEKKMNGTFVNGISFEIRKFAVFNVPKF